ncbi:chemotaxis protein MotB [Thermosyntropha lipolytica DSM 11003]|uniref:Chemotaxis protein MotB n=1 Tax=Thermosyntropha lipolytica DSM 11003 TaxID=1123382 RepID=A0A1M5K3T4_9FIRM|nr:flagellar motor protein MotB [Thermosyntropha lipolytica]SHG47468.1 chemotaxis protein MotB [Thermosyntropha lipolytica DSM 11003]
MAKRHKKHEGHIDETWLIPYADMLTLLLALFIVLFAMSQVDQQKFEEFKRMLQSLFAGGPGIMTTGKALIDEGEKPNTENPPTQSLIETQKLEQYKEALDRYFKEQGIEALVTTTVNEKGLQIIIRDVALFDSGKADIKPEAMPILRDLSVILASLDNNIEVSGHTDNLPINTPQFPSNWELSTQRALNVMKFLLQNPDLDPARFSVVGYGEYRPIANNATVQGRAMNRRVEILLLRKYKIEDINLNFQ